MLADGPSGILALGRATTKDAGARTMDKNAAQPSPDSSRPTTEDCPDTGESVLAERHPVLSRLMEEVRNESTVTAGYDRVHNRHNRGR